MRFNQSLLFFIISILFVSVSFNSHAQLRDCYFAADVDPKDVMLRLFEAKWDEDEQVGKWKPNWGEMQDFEVSYDGFLYTKIDTVFKFHINGEKHLLLLTSTRQKDENGNYNSFSMSTVALSMIELVHRNQDNTWEAIMFRKFAGNHGAYEETIGNEFYRLWDDLYLVGTYDGRLNRGYEYTLLTLFLNGVEVFQETMSEGNLAAVENESDAFSYEKKLIIDKINKCLVLKSQGTKFDERLKKVVPFNKSVVYKLNEYRKFTILGK